MTAHLPALMMLGIWLPLAFPAEVAPPLTLKQVLHEMDEHDRVRIASLARYTCTRRYTLDNRRFHLTAELSVRMIYCYPGHKKFEVLGERGSSVIRQRVLRRMLEAEAEASRDDIRESTRIMPLNYAFQFLGVEVREGRSAYVLKIAPTTNNKFSLRGKIWVDSEDFGIVRVEAAPAQNPSGWIRNIHVVQQYEKHGPVWLPLFNHSETDSFLFGHTQVTIDSSNYEISEQTASLPISSPRSASACTPPTQTQ